MCTMDLLKDSCSEAMMRLAIFVLNALFLMVGVVFIVVGFLVEFEYSHFEVNFGACTMYITRSSIQAYKIVGFG